MLFLYFLCFVFDLSSVGNTYNIYRNFSLPRRVVQYTSIVDENVDIIKRVYGLSESIWRNIPTFKNCIRIYI